MFVTAVFIQAILATAALAIPSSHERHASRVARRAGGVRQGHTKKTNETNPEYSPNWAGAVWNSPQGTYQEVTATFIVPTAKNPSGSSGGSTSPFNPFGLFGLGAGAESGAAAAAWVGIDGDSCSNAILQTGVDFTVDGDSTTYDAWYEWYPAESYDFSGITFKAGDSVTLTVTATSTTSGTVNIMNNSNGKTVSKALTSKHALCQQDAEWIVEDFQQGESLVPFADFGTVAFTGATAKTASGAVGPSGAKVIDIQQDGEVLTSVSTSDSSVTVSYI